MQRGGFVRKQKCPKCGGNIFLDVDAFGWYEQCLQCGYSGHLGKLVHIEGESKDKYFTEAEKVVAARK